MADPDYFPKLVKELERRIELLERNKSGSGGGSTNPLLSYPVGSIFMSVVNNNPGNIFGGTWVAWGSGRVPVGVGSGQFAGVETQVGTENHTLTQAQIPSYGIGFIPSVVMGNHGDWSNGGVQSSSSATTGKTNMVQAVTGNSVAATGTQWGWQINSNGSGSAHNNVQPSITCYMWKRTA